MFESYITRTHKEAIILANVIGRMLSPRDDEGKGGQPVDPASEESLYADPANPFDQRPPRPSE